MTDTVTMTLCEPELTRKQQFDAALAAAHMTQVQWRTEVYKVTKQHLAYVLNGERPGSAALNAAIDGLIAKYGVAA